MVADNRVYRSGKSEYGSRKKGKRCNYEIAIQIRHPVSNHRYPVARTPQHAPPNQIPEDRRQKTDDRFQKTNIAVSNRPAPCAMHYALCPSPHIPHLAIRIPQLATRLHLQFTGARCRPQPVSGGIDVGRRVHHGMDNRRLT